ncbi:MAG: DUF6506 family protein [Candidatus Delongbacteria bacterium]|jgi:hypothetical protein|nr:DUF6506 family protein [Candidatus Delongbacteria bacterium]
MAFNALFMAHAPDADYKKHRSLIDTGTYRVFSVVVKSQEEAKQVSTTLVKEEGIQAILLCPGFTHNDVADLFNHLDG